MRAAAQLVAVALDPDGADPLTVLLVEERVGAGVDGLLHAHDGWRHRPVVADDAANLVLDRSGLVAGEGPVEREVEAKVVGRDQRPGLAGVVADDIPERAVE